MLMTFIQHMASAGSPEKSAGRAALSSGVAVDMGVADSVKGVAVVLGVAGEKTRCQWGLGLLEGAEAMGLQGDVEATVEVEGCGGGEGDISSLLELSKSPKAPELQGDDMLGGKSCS